MSKRSDVRDSHLSQPDPSSRHRLSKANTNSLLMSSAERCVPLCRFSLENILLVMQRPPVSTSEYPDSKRISLVRSLVVSGSVPAV